MKWLLILLSVVTFTVKDKRTVTMEGEWPFDIGVSYANTYNKGQVRDGDTAVLSVSGLEGVALDTIKVWLKSNKSGGAGVLTMRADGGMLYETSGTYEEWFGAYNNTDFQPLVWQGPKVLRDGTLQIRLVGTANSLHIDRYEVVYRMNMELPHTVTLMRGNEQMMTLTESARGQGVQLPASPDENTWRFAAWTEQPFYQTSTMPQSWIETGTFVPETDCTLWAVYAYEMTDEEAAVTDLADGEYVYADLVSGNAMSGSVTNGKAGTSTIDRDDPNQYYSVRFLPDNTATIQHSGTGDFIGYEGTNLSTTASAWQVYHEGKKTAFYTLVNTKTYILWPDKLQGGAQEFRAQLVETDDVTETTTALLMTEPDMDEPVLTCYPEYGLGIETTSESKRELENEGALVPFGIYYLKIINGRKYLELR